MSSFRILVLSLAVTPLAATLAPGLAAQASRPVGQWQLERNHGDTSTSKMVPRAGGWGGQPPPGSAPGPGAGGGGGGAPGGPAYGGGGARPGGGYRGGGIDEKLRARIHHVMELARHAAQRVDISQDARTVTFTDDSGAVRIWPIDGKKLKDTLADGSDLETSFRWAENDLVYERKLGGGVKLTETYRLGLGGSRLIAYVSIDGLMGPSDFTRQYAPADTNQ